VGGDPRKDGPDAVGEAAAQQRLAPPGWQIAGPSAPKVANIRSHNGTGRSSSTAFFFTTASLPPVTRTSRAALAHAQVVFSSGSSSVLVVRCTRPWTIGSMTSPVSSAGTSSRACARVSRPVWVTRRPGPTHWVNATTRVVHSETAASP